MKETRRRWVDNERRYNRGEMYRECYGFVDFQAVSARRSGKDK
jgi:hypothetical protein